MKKSLKVISSVLLAAMLGTAAVVPASAKTLFVSQEVASYVPNSPKAFEERNPVDAPGAVVYTGQSAVYSTVVQLPDYRPACTGYGWNLPVCGNVLPGGCYYSAAEGRRAVNDYLAANSYNTIMLLGDSRKFCDGAYYYSSDPSVCYYDYTNGCLVGKSCGIAQVYVYTRGGVPITRLDVDVRAHLPEEKKEDVLFLTPDDWNPSIGGISNIAVKSKSGKVYNDIVFSIIRGSDLAYIGTENGKLTGCHNGTVFVRAHSKSNDKVFGETFLYVGDYTASIYDGCWSSCKDGIRVSNWGYDVYDVCGVNGSYLTGWIRTDGIYIPVVKMYDAVQTTSAGSQVGTKVLVGDSLSYLDLLRLAYGDKSDLTTIIGGYNLSKYGYPGIVYNAYDYRTLLLASILGLIQ